MPSVHKHWFLIVPKYRCKISFRVGRLVQMQGEAQGDWMRGSERFERLGTLIKVFSAGFVNVFLWHLVGYVNE